MPTHAQHTANRAPLPTDTLTAAWRAAHGAAVAHLLASSYAECGCTALGLCQEGQTLDEIAEDAERRLALIERRWS